MKHALITIRYFDIHGAQYHDMILNQCIDILPYRYVLQIPSAETTFLCTNFSMKFVTQVALPSLKGLVRFKVKY